MMPTLDFIGDISYYINKSAATNVGSIHGGLISTLNLKELTAMTDSIDITNPPEKQCAKCKEYFPATLEFFYQNLSSKQDLSSWCKGCSAIHRDKYRAKNKEKIAKQRAQYRIENKEKLAKKSAQWHTENKEKIAKRYAEYRADNKEKLAKKKAQWYTKNRYKIAKKKAVYHASPANYKTYASKLLGIERIRQSKKIKGAIEVKCSYCGAWFLPTNMQVQHRVVSINEIGGRMFYCSDGCKQACPTYNQQKHPKGFKKATSREANPLLRQLVLKRDNYTCQKCGATIGDKVQLHCHHVLPATQNPMTANDPENCTCLCKKCHIAVHKTPGCKNHELRCLNG